MQATEEQVGRLGQEVGRLVTPDQARALVLRELRSRDQADSDKWQVNLSTLQSALIDLPLHVHHRLPFFSFVLFFGCQIQEKLLLCSGPGMLSGFSMQSHALVPTDVNVVVALQVECSTYRHWLLG